MWENPIFKKVWEVGKKSAVLMKKHYKNGLMLGVLLLAMFFLGRSIGAIAYGLRMQREIKTQATAGTALENTEALLFSRKLGIGIRDGRNTAHRHGICGKTKRVQCLLCGRCGGEKNLSHF